jgi:hypothetical protein
MSGRGDENNTDYQEGDSAVNLYIMMIFNIQIMYLIKEGPSIKRSSLISYNSLFITGISHQISL